MLLQATPAPALHLQESRLFPFAGTEREPVDAKAGEAGVAGAPEGVSAAAAGGGGGGPAAAAEAVLRAPVSAVQEEDAAGAPQPGAGPAARGEQGLHRRGKTWESHGIYTFMDPLER